jgi:hypothetical protein
VSLPVFIGSGAAQAGTLGLGIGPAQQRRGPHRLPSGPGCQPCAVTGLGPVIRGVPGDRSPGHDLDLDSPSLFDLGSAARDRVAHVTVLFWCGGDCTVQAPIARQRGSLPFSLGFAAPWDSLSRGLCEPGDRRAGTHRACLWGTVEAVHCNLAAVPPPQVGFAASVLGVGGRLCCCSSPAPFSSDLIRSHRPALLMGSIV